MWRNENMELKCPKCGNSEEFELEERNWVRYFYKNGEITDDLPEVVGDCDDDNRNRHVFCSKCREEMDYEKFEEWMGWK